MFNTSNWKINTWHREYSTIYVCVPSQLFGPDTVLLGHWYFCETYQTDTESLVLAYLINTQFYILPWHILLTSFPSFLISSCGPSPNYQYLIFFSLFLFVSLYCPGFFLLWSFPMTSSHIDPASDAGLWWEKQLASASQGPWRKSFQRTARILQGVLLPAERWWYLQAHLWNQEPVGVCILYQCIPVLIQSTCVEQSWRQAWMKLGWVTQMRKKRSQNKTMSIQ